MLDCLDILLKVTATRHSPSVSAGDVEMRAATHKRITKVKCPCLRITNNNNQCLNNDLVNYQGNALGFQTSRLEA